MNYPLDTGLNTKALCKWVPRMEGPCLKGEFLQVVRGWAQAKGALLARRSLDSLENCFGGVVIPFAMKYLPRQLYIFGKYKINSFWWHIILHEHKERESS